MEFIIGALNINDIIEINKREEIERWMESQVIQMPSIQETHIWKETTELKQKYTWCLGEPD